MEVDLAGGVVFVTSNTQNFVVNQTTPDVTDVYIDADHNKMSATFNRIPALSDVPYPVHMEPNLVVEFYSR